MKNKKNIKKPLKSYHKYAESVIKGDILACKWITLACKRFVDDLKACKGRGLLFDEKAADSAIKFFTFLPHIKGEWAGQPMKLEPWEAFIIANLFGWKRADGNRRFKTGYVEVSRKNGKSSLLAGVGIYLTKFDDEPGSEVYSAAVTRDQAKLVFGIAQEMVKRSRLNKYLKTFKTSIFCDQTASKFGPLSSDFNSLDGLNIHGAIVDELHAHPNRELYDVLKTATGSRRQPLIVSITTAGYDRNSICWEMHSYCEKIMEGVLEDDSFFGMIYTLDEGDDWQDEENWIKANPNLGVSVKLADLQEKAKTAKEIPSELNSFLRKHMDIWTESVTRWISVEKWNACDFPVHEDELAGKTCYGGLDLSSTTDITALALLFPPEHEGAKYKLLMRFWIPEDNMRERVRRDRVPYDVWEREGFIVATPGNVIDYGFIINQISEDAQKFDLKELAFDRWGATKIMQDLQNMGFERPQDNKHSERNLVDFGQGFASMSSPTKELEKMILAQELAHGGNSVLRWMASNVVIREDAAGNMKPDKGKSTEKIDGIVSLIMAIDRAVRHEETGMPEILVL